MNPNSPFPFPDPVPLAAPFALFGGLLLLTFLFHLIAMNLLVGGSILALANQFGRSPSTRQRREWVFSSLISLLPTLMAATVTLGVAPLLFVQVLYGRTFYSSSIVLGGRWFAVIFLLIAAYALFYRLAFGIRKKKSAGRKRRRIWMLALSSFLLLGVAFLYVNNMSLMLRPEAMIAKYATGSHWNLDDWTLLPRYLHMVTGALAVTGLALALYGIEAGESSSVPAESVSRYGAGVFIAATAFNIVIGTIFLMTLPREVLIELLTVDRFAAIALVSAILAGLVALGSAFLALATPFRRFLLWMTAFCLVATLISMILFRDQLRSVLLAELPPPSWIEPQWGAIAIFLVLLAAGTGILGLMAYWWHREG